MGQLAKSSANFDVVFIGERRLDRENHEIFTIYDRLTKHFEKENLKYIDLTANNNLYKGESKLDHLHRDLNIVRHAEYVLTIGISGFVDLCSLITTVYTMGVFNHSYTKLIWNNSGHQRLQICKNLNQMKDRLLSKK